MYEILLVQFTKHTGDTLLQTYQRYVCTKIPRVSQALSLNDQEFGGKSKKNKNKKLLSISYSVILTLNIYEDHVGPSNDLGSMVGRAIGELEN